MPDAPAPAPVDCPRCAYDLTGAVQTWTESCPVHGMCSECGLEFAWADILRADRRRLSWLYEHVKRWWNVRSIVVTVWRVLIPWSFWRRVQIHHEMRLRRILMLLMLLVVPGVLTWIAATIESVRLAPQFAVYFPTWSTTPSGTEILAMLLDPLGSVSRYSEWQPGILADQLVASALAFSAGFAISLLIAQSVRQTAKIRTTLVVRAYLYGLVPLALLSGAELALMSGWTIESMHETLAFQAWRSANPGRWPTFQNGTFGSLWASFGQGGRDIVFLTYWLWLLAYWPIAIVRGMRMPKWGQIITVGAILAVLMALAAASTVSAFTSPI